MHHFKTNPLQSVSFLLACLLLTGCEHMGLSLDDFEIQTNPAIGYDEHASFLMGVIGPYKYDDYKDNGITIGFIYGKDPSLTDAREITGIPDEDRNIILKAEGLEEYTTYYYRVFARYKKDCIYGGTVSFKTLTFAAAEAIDLGLPSGTLWSSVNLGAGSPDEYGARYAWGETEPKPRYLDSNYKWGDWLKFTKYCNNPEYGLNGFTDGKLELEAQDDPARQKLGGAWTIPSDADIREILNEAYIHWENAVQNGVKGFLATSVANGNTIFIPDCDGSPYISSTLNAQACHVALGFTDASSSVVIHSGAPRSQGSPIRPVKK